MAFIVPGLAAQVAKLPANGGKAGADYSVREQALLKSVKEYVDSLPAGSVTLAELAPGIAPSHVVKYAGRATSVGGSASESFAVAGVLATDEVFVQVRDNGTNNVSVLQAVTASNAIQVTFSADPGNDAVIAYQVIRAAS